MKDPIVGENLRKSEEIKDPTMGEKKMTSKDAPPHLELSTSHLSM